MINNDLVRRWRLCRMSGMVALVFLLCVQQTFGIANNEVKQIPAEGAKFYRTVSGSVKIVAKGHATEDKFQSREPGSEQTVTSTVNNISAKVGGSEIQRKITQDSGWIVTEDSGTEKTWERNYDWEAEIETTDTGDLVFFVNWTVTTIRTRPNGNGESSQEPGSKAPHIKVEIDATGPTLEINQAPPSKIFDRGPAFPVVIRGKVVDSQSGVKSIEWNLDGGPFQSFSGDLSNWKIETTIQPGSHTFIVRSVDQVNNPTERSVGVVAEIDSTGPTLDIGAPKEVHGPGPTFPVIITGKATDGQSGVKSVDWNLDGGPFQGGSGDWSNWKIETTVQQGPHTFTVRSLDKLNNSTERTAPVIAVGPTGSAFSRSLTFTNSSGSTLKFKVPGPLLVDDPNNLPTTTLLLEFGKDGSIAATDPALGSAVSFALRQGARTLTFTINALPSHDQTFRNKWVTMAQPDAANAPGLYLLSIAHQQSLPSEGEEWEIGISGLPANATPGIRANASVTLGGFVDLSPTGMQAAGLSTVSIFSRSLTFSDNASSTMKFKVPGPILVDDPNNLPTTTLMLEFGKDGSAKAVDPALGDVVGFVLKQGAKTLPFTINMLPSQDARFSNKLVTMVRPDAANAPGLYLLSIVHQQSLPPAGEDWELSVSGLPTNATPSIRTNATLGLGRFLSP